MEQLSAKRRNLILLICMLLIPTILIFAHFYLDEARYYLTSSLVVLLSLIPFILLFERRQAQAKEIVLISVICAIAVAGRTAFYMLPQFKPLVAIVIIAGVCLGSESGFMVGAISAFVSNFFVGQGPWTPYQMLALAIIGALAGFLFSRKLLKPKLFNLCVFGFLSTYLIYGLILDAHFTLAAFGTITLKNYVVAITSGFFPNLLHSTASVLFLLLFAKPFMKQIDRITIKYGLVFGENGH